MKGVEFVMKRLDCVSTPNGMLYFGACKECGQDPLLPDDKRLRLFVGDMTYSCPYCEARCKLRSSYEAIGSK